jgi:hypothetical protein
MWRSSVLAQFRTSVCTGNGQALQSALRGARAVICTGRLGDLPSAAEQGGLEHLIVVSSAGQPAAAYIACKAAVVLCVRISERGASFVGSWPRQCKLTRLAGRMSGPCIYELVTVAQSECLIGARRTTFPVCI